MKFTIPLHLTVFVNLLLHRTACERLPEIGSRLCQSWKFDVVDGEYKEYIGNIFIDLENAGQVLYSYIIVYLVLGFAAGRRKIWSVPQLPLGKHIQADAEIINLPAHTAGHTLTCISAGVLSNAHAQGHKSTVKFHVRLPVKERNQFGSVRHRCFYRVVAQPGDRRSKPCFLKLKAEYGSFLQSCLDSKRHQPCKISYCHVE